MKWMILPVDLGIKENIYNKLLMNELPKWCFYLITAWSSLPYHENYTDQYVKAMQSDEFHYYKFIWT